MRALFLPLVCLASCGGHVAGPGAVTSGDSGTVAPSCVGAGVTVLASLPRAMLSDLKVDGANAYFVDSASPANLSKIPLCGGSVIPLGTANDTLDLGTEKIVGGVTLAQSAADVFFLGGPSMGRVPKAGGPSALIASDKAGLEGSGMTLGGSFVYWLQYPSSTNVAVAELDRVPAGGGTPSTVASGLAVNSAAGVTDGTSYYWSGVDGTINRIPLAGGAVTVLATGTKAASGIALDSTYVYWSLSSACAMPIGGTPCPAPSATAASIQRVPIAGGVATTVVTDFDVSGIAVDEQNVYWVDTNDSVKWALLPAGTAAGSEAHTLAAAEAVYLGPVLGSDAVYWVSSSSQIKRAPKPH